MNPNIAIITGGFEAEKVISYKSAKQVYNALNKNKYNPFLLDIRLDGWFLLDTDIPIDKNDFSIVLDGNKIVFDFCFMALHGSPVEDGMMQGYLNMLDIPFTGGNGKTMAITMDKIASKKILKQSTDIKTADFIQLRPSDNIPHEDISKLGYPLFVKPNSVGSSFGVTKVKEPSELENAIKEAFKFDDYILIEKYIKGREFTQGIISDKGTIKVLSPTEIIPKTEFFDYEAKYKGASEEITPADLPKETIELMTSYSERIFQLFDCEDFARVDYLMEDGELYFIEINTVPGLSKASLLPQQLSYENISFDQFVQLIIDNYNI